jgi:hypothetical protein
LAKEEEWKKRLGKAEKEYERQKELEQVRLEKWKAAEIEESREETEKKPQGSSKKVSKMFFLWV